MRTICALTLLLTVACSPIGPSPGEDAGNNQPTDAATGGDHHVADSGRRDTGTGRDRTGFDWLAFDIASIDIAGYDIGMREYDGGSEPGVVCSDSTCTGEPCCAGFTGTACAGGQACGQYTVQVPCDGNEDCDAGVCMVATSGYSYSIRCVAPGTPDAGQPVCVNSSQCDAGGVCCSATFLNNFGVDLGWCETAHCGN